MLNVLPALLIMPLQLFLYGALCGVAAGDLGCRLPRSAPGSNMGGNIVITGRAKDTIVLTNGVRFYLGHQVSLTMMDGQSNIMP